MLLPRGTRDAARRLAWLKTPALKLAENEVRSQSSAQAAHAPRLLRSAAARLRCRALSADSLAMLPAQIDRLNKSADEGGQHAVWLLHFRRED